MKLNSRELLITIPRNNLIELPAHKGGIFIQM